MEELDVVRIEQLGVEQPFPLTFDTPLAGGCSQTNLGFIGVTCDPSSGAFTMTNYEDSTCTSATWNSVD
eukprot:4018390-Prymnesium_polylepis.1